MSRLSRYRLLAIIVAVAIVEAMCRIGWIDRFTMQPPLQIAIDLWKLLVSGKHLDAIGKTMGNAAIGFVLAVSAGVVVAVAVHRRRLLRETLEPLFATYYAIPVLAFYPLLIILFGVGDAPKITIAFMLGVIAVIVNLLNGLDRVPPVLIKTARVVGMGPTQIVWRVTLPFSAPYLLTGVKFALAYSLIGIIGSEFIMSTDGMGFEISFAYNNFDNATMYPLIVLILLISISLNFALGTIEKQILQRRGLR
ncbi:MAG: ABC transporter permease [Burkholderiaceae bacterium]